MTTQKSVRIKAYNLVLYLSNFIPKWFESSYSWDTEESEKILDHIW